MNIINICLVAIIGTITAVIIKGHKPEFGILVVMALSLVFFGWMIDVFAEMGKQFETIAEQLNQNRSFYKILFKIMGITYICEFSSGLCKDAGYSSISTQIEIIGKMLVLLSGLPILLSVIDTIEKY